jgi:hypothetical protein
MFDAFLYLLKLHAIGKKVGLLGVAEQIPHASVAQCPNVMMSLLGSTIVSW